MARREAGDGGGRVAQGFLAYRLIVRMWMRSALAYRASFLMMAFGNFAANALDFVAIMLMFSRIDALGGFSLPEVAFLYGTSGVSLGLADLLLGSIEGLGRRVRDGTLDVLLLRPAPVFAQVAADRFALRRLGRITQALLVLGWSLPHLPVEWTVGRVLMVPLMAVCGTAIFAAVFTAGAAFQFWAQDAAEVQNSFTYGGNAMLQYPPTVFARELVRGVTFLVPLAFVNWLPALRLLGRPDPLGLPGWVDFLGPVVAALMCMGAGLAWRLGLQAYRSTGS
ncbi:ABC-2 type transport system permease protein [Streptomyces sp. 2112.3]|nr:ABC-2 type transport system permease protein [Streptomyces sp. 2321.6]SDR48456.1 ABC-2 type transport system permease protein [Streptomyces sp. KS_16]SEC65214.1 ABC-2 type transport system permease protein [Streptomyces sp. 2133.1]SEE94899.1 ABC-2 type transport system permease protein [Streptomyces sp. 2112.3]SNC68697.1 ABC-2 type transport system permease protein [Streptomyces sp. 2114.4]